ncbi:MAG: zinc-binding alcohol dehydrogenase family protein [Bacteroidetes bacterium]|nr:zinc-binding alcohol dehydrogenase family protein [Bacteroidota bacterium]
MKYIVCNEPRQFVMKEKVEPQYGENEVLLQIKTIGICGTDLHAYAGQQAYFNYPRILGHELGSQVLETGKNVSNVKVGDKVVVMPYIGCGNCIACRNGKTNCCTQIKVLGVHIDGGMQEKISVPANILLPVNNLNYNEIAIIEPLAIGAHGLRRAAIEAGEYIVVIGCGPIGIGMMKIGQILGAKVIAIDVVESRLNFAKDKIGVEYTVNARENPVEAIAKITNSDMATAVFDASGNKFALEHGPLYLAHGGRYVLVGLSKGDLTFNHPAIHSKETTLMCSRNATLEDFQLVIDTLSTGQFPTDAFVTHTVAFDEMIDHFEGWLDPKAGVIKAMVSLE